MRLVSAKSGAASICVEIEGLPPSPWCRPKPVPIDLSGCWFIWGSILDQPGSPVKEGEIRIVQKDSVVTAILTLDGHAFGNAVQCGTKPASIDVTGCWTVVQTMVADSGWADSLSGVLNLRQNAPGSFLGTLLWKGNAPPETVNWGFYAPDGSNFGFSSSSSPAQSGIVRHNFKGIFKVVENSIEGNFFRLDTNDQVMPGATARLRGRPGPCRL